MIKSIFGILTIIILLNGCSVAQKTKELGKGMSNTPLLPLGVLIYYVGNKYEKEEMEARREEIEKNRLAKLAEEEVKTEEIKTEEIKTEEIKTEEIKTEEIKTEEVN